MLGGRDGARAGRAADASNVVGEGHFLSRHRLVKYETAISRNDQRSSVGGEYAAPESSLDRGLPEFRMYRRQRSIAPQMERNYNTHRCQKKTREKRSDPSVAKGRVLWLLRCGRRLFSRTVILSRRINPNAALLNLGLIRQNGNKYTGDAWVKAEGGAASLYIRDPRQRAQLIPRLKTYFSSMPDIDRVYTNEEARLIGLPSDAVSDQAPQLYLAAAPDYAFGDDITGPITRTHPVPGQHGYLNSMSDMRALFVASGAAIKPGIHLA